MIRNLKALGLAIMAVLALSAVGASASQAANFTAAEYPATLEGEQKAEKSHLFTLAGGRTVTCASAKFHGSLAGASETVTITPTYSTCHANILGAILPATVTMGDCDYMFHISGGSVHSFTGTADLECTNTDVEIHVYKEGVTPAQHTVENQVCRYTVKQQTGLGPIDYNVITGSPNDLEVNATVNNVAYTRVQGLLGPCGAASGTATYTGNTTVKAFNGGGTQISGSID